MGGACSRKRDQQTNEDNVHGGVSRRNSKSGSSKWLGTSFSRASVDNKERKGICPSLMELCIYKISEENNQYGNFSMLTRDISQQIFNELVYSQRLNEACLEVIQDCALQDINLGEYPGIDDTWMDVISSQGSSLLSPDLSCSDVTDYGLSHIKDCKSVKALNFNFCQQISDVGLGCISGLKKLAALNVNCCNCITDTDMKPLSDLTNLKELQISCRKVTDHGVTFLKGLHKLALLNMERCPITAACLDSFSELVALLYLNASRSNVTDDGCDKFSKILKGDEVRPNF